MITAQSIWRGWWGIARVAVMVRTSQALHDVNPLHAYHFLRWITGGLFGTDNIE